MTAKWPPVGCQQLDRGDHHPLAPVVSTAVTAATLLLAFGLLGLGVESFWVVFVVGFGVVFPVSMGLLESVGDSSRSSRSRSEDALEELRLRYARGELTHEEFERRVGELVETESENRTRL